MNDSPPHPEAPRPVDCDDGLRRDARTPAYRRPGGTGWLVPLVWVLLAMGCSVSPLDLKLKRCPCAEGWTCDTQTKRCVLGDLADAGRWEPAPVPTPPDAGSKDASQPPSDAGDPRMDDAGGPGIDDATTRPDATSDAAMEPSDAGPPVKYPASGCFTSATAIVNCQLTKDGIHTTGFRHTCASGDDVCTFADTCATSGCVRDVWLAQDLGDIRTITQARFLSDWFNKRPKNYEIWASNSPTDVPLAGATLIATAVGHPSQWRCVQGESCADRDVPDECCPDGRDAPQAPTSMTIPKFDIVDFRAHAARYWYLFVRDTYGAQFLIMQEMEYLGPP